MSTIRAVNDGTAEGGQRRPLVTRVSIVSSGLEA